MTKSTDRNRGIINRITGRSVQLLAARLAIGIFICFDLENTAFQPAMALEVESESKTQQSLSRETLFFKGQLRDAGWLSVKFDGSVLDLNPARVDALAWYGFKLPEPGQVEKTSVTDTRMTLKIWDDRISWTSRQAFSNYVKPGVDLGYLKQSEVGFESGATSQRLDMDVFKSDSMRLSLFAEYAKVGAYFMAPDIAIKRQDPFSTPNSTTNRFGAAVEQGPFKLTLEQRVQQSLAQENAPVLVQNQAGVSLAFDALLGQNGWSREGLSWLLPSSAWINFGRGKVSAIVTQGVAGDTTSDMSYGLSWNVGKIDANFGYWQSAYQSQLYPWKGFGINGSLGYHEALWGIDLYFNLASSSAPYYLAGAQQPTTQELDITSGILLRARF